MCMADMDSVAGMRWMRLVSRKWWRNLNFNNYSLWKMSIKNEQPKIFRCTRCNRDLEELICTHCNIEYKKNDIPYFLTDVSEEILQEIDVSGKEFDNNFEYIDVQIQQHENILKDIRTIIHPNSKILEIAAFGWYISKSLAKDNNVTMLDIFYPFAIPWTNPLQVYWCMEKLPFRDAMFDYVIITSALHHTSYLEKTFSEVSRVLKAWWKFLIFNEVSKTYFWTWDNIKEVNDGWYNDQEYSIADYKKSSESYFDFEVKVPKLIYWYINNDVLINNLKWHKRFLLRIFKSIPGHMEILQLIYPVLHYFIFVPSFFVLTKK